MEEQDKELLLVQGRMCLGWMGWVFRFGVDDFVKVLEGGWNKESVI